MRREHGIADGARQVNPHGGGIAPGHSLGKSGARLLPAAVHPLAKTGGRLGLATLCVGAGQGPAPAVERVVEKARAPGLLGNMAFWVLVTQVECYVMFPCVTT
ncbi:hypothetical protein HAQ05_03685 [Pseudomonas sp. CA3A]|uniref:Thiolase C-terminal domain-containing protein n=1 Tax=Pseudomonas typographi TaxID=2715964 RepID=A0ABR7YX90_9PSED|nr:hypothetical protein [Pseudomonas typographi]